jgi:diacylglycerol kinase (ATP)
METRIKAESSTPAEDGSNLKGKTGVRRLINATRYSRDGLIEAWRNEDAFRQEVVLVVVLAPLALWLPIALAEKILLIGVLLVLLIVELLNSAVEAAIDRDSLEINSLGKRAKDLGSAAVMLALVLAGGTWISVLWTNFGYGFR